ncbi:YtxH domain-containing protein [Catalinimonas niigatensis]|uniref:YtxH domain-containing protein n=1 Tax=Catalinimonas niigatensis TaxID=1397264 RepID=UPI002666B7AA|nr:YtxH domain-containing protein [Catalinimonas niigatensis]WPP53383.1 YtxH domain-containing protein [Catalinimonas niigatensis]
MSKTGSSLLMFFSGLLAGTLFGVLYAPDAGINTRDRVTFRLEKYKGKLEELLTDLVRSKEQLPESAAKSDGERVINDAREKAKQLLDDVDNLLDQIKK